MKRVYLCCAFLFLCSCEKRDYNYYAEHAEAHQEKLQDCEARMKASMLTKDRAGVEAVLKDEECKLVEKVQRDKKAGRIELSAEEKAQQEQLKNEAKNKAQEAKAAKMAEEQRQEDERKAKIEELKALSEEEMEARLQASSGSPDYRLLADAKRALDEEYRTELKNDPEKLLKTKQDCDIERAAAATQERIEISSKRRCRIADLEFRQRESDTKAIERSKLAEQEEAEIKRLLNLAPSEFDAAYQASAANEKGCGAACKAKSRYVNILEIKMKADLEKSEVIFNKCATDFQAAKKTDKNTARGIADTVGCKAAWNLRQEITGKRYCCNWDAVKFD